MKVKIFEDIVCPYCYIGMKNLETAAANLGLEVEAEVLSFELDPERDDETDVGVVESLEEMYGLTEEEALAKFSHSTEMAREAGLEIDMLQAKVTNTHKGHKLLQYAKTEGKGTEFFHLAQVAYFAKGLPLNDPEVLVDLAAEAGLDPAKAREVLESDAFEAEVEAEQRAAEEKQINYVPHVVLPSGRFVEGVLTVPMLEEALREEVAETGAN